MPEISLAKVVEQAQNGDSRAFDCLVRRFQNSAIAYARTMLGDPAAAEDAAQEAFVRAWQDLPDLREPAAFGGWLRRIVFKYCDRARRAARLLLPISEALPAPADHEPAALLENADQSARVHAAVDALPCLLRETTLLYYLTGQSVSEIAAFLELPQSTIKNRLHSARKRLRKELGDMAQGRLSIENNTAIDEFATAILARVLREFQRQETTDRHTADRSLLDQGRAALLEVVESAGQLDVAAIRDGFMVLMRKRDYVALSALLMRYLGQPLSDSEVAWAYLQLTYALAESGGHAGAVLAHEAFERHLDAKAPRLSTVWPFYPVADDALERSWAGDDLRLLIMFQAATIGYAYLHIWRVDAYLTKVDKALVSIVPTSGNRHPRFFVRRMAAYACEEAQNYGRVQDYVSEMYILADEGEDEDERAELRLKALGHDIRLASLRKDDDRFEECVRTASALLDGYSNKKYLAAGAAGKVPGWIRGQRHDLAHYLVAAGRYGEALPLLEANLASGGQFGGWGWMMHAAAVWQVTRDRQRTLSLLREAVAHDDGDLVEMFTDQAEFADVWQDPDFLKAVTR